MSSISDTALASGADNRSGVNRIQPRSKPPLYKDLSLGLSVPSQPPPARVGKEPSNLSSPETLPKSFRTIFRRNKASKLSQNHTSSTSQLSLHTSSPSLSCQLESHLPTSADEMVVADGGRSGGHGRENSMVGGQSSGAIHRPSLAESVSTASFTSSKSNGSIIGLDEKPVASGNGVFISIILAEPTLYLQGFDQADLASRSTSMLRGTFHLKVSKSAKIKTISLNFRGRAETEWPEGESFSLPFRSVTDTIQESPPRRRNLRTGKV